jgi:hypothetical protein
VLQQPKPKPVVETPARSQDSQPPLRESTTPVKSSSPSSRQGQNSPTEQTPEQQSPTTPVEKPSEPIVPIIKGDPDFERKGDGIQSQGSIISKKHLPKGFNSAKKPEDADLKSAFLTINLGDKPVLVKTSAKFSKGEKFQVAVSLAVICEQTDRLVCRVPLETIRLTPNQSVTPEQFEFAKAILTSDRTTYRASIETKSQVPVTGSDWIVTVEIAII